MDAAKYFIGSDEYRNEGLADVLYLQALVQAELFFTRIRSIGKVSLNKYKEKLIDSSVTIGAGDNGADRGAGGLFLKASSDDQAAKTGSNLNRLY